MSTTLVALHGFTQNGALLRAQLQALVPRLARAPRLSCPDAPHTCSEAGLRRLRTMLGGDGEPPHLSWWDATDDGREYRGWEVTRELIRRELDMSGGGPVGLLGFSQGAILAAVTAALSARGELPPIAFAVLVAGRIPRAEALQPLFSEPVRVPSLHVWGTRDVLTAPVSALLVERFDPGPREVEIWSGPHVLPTRGPAADAIVRFLDKHT